MMTRLSTHAATGGKPAGLPVPAIRVKPPARRSASLGPMMAPGPGLQDDSFPEPKLQTIWFVAGSSSITRLLNWSVISMFPGVLNGPPPCKPDGAADDDDDADDDEEEEPVEAEVADAELDEDEDEAPDADVVDVGGVEVV